MAVTKGIVSGGNYTFVPVDKSITFSSDYLGMSLSDITYITNVKNGVATVIYDPFDPAKGGVLQGLVLYLDFDTSLMSSTDPLQIIVGFTPSTATPQNVNITPNTQLDSQTELLQSIAESTDLLAKVVDSTEGIQVNVTDPTILKDTNRIPITINSDLLEVPGVTFARANDALEVDTTGYGTVIFTVSSVAVSVINTVEVSQDKRVWFGTSYISNASNLSGGTLNGAGATFSISSGVTYTYIVATSYRYVRLRCSSYFSGSCSVRATLRSQASAINYIFNTAAANGLPVQVQGGSVAVSSSIGSLTAGGGVNNQAGALYSGGITAPGSTTVAYPVLNGGREAPYTGVLAGVVRMNLTDSQGRYILGADYDATRPRDPISGLAQGPYGNAPVRGIGGRQNTMHGSQALLVEDVGQSEGDTIPTLLQQILVELKMLNQQINELPFTLNQGLHMQNEVAEYRTEEYNNHVNNQ